MPPGEAFTTKRLIAFVCMVFGMFMAILDIQIVAASLAQIQAGVNASAEEITWVQTSYLIAEVIMIPMSGYLSRALSTRWMFALSAGGFTLMSLMCATSSTINELIVWRALQGFIGGGMIPTVFAVSYTVIPPARRVMVAPIIGLVATLAPTVGPTIGGYLTDLFSWHWLFLVNVVPGIAVTIGAIALIDFDRPEHGLLRRFDWIGFALMATFLGTLEYVLEEGPQDDWFESQTVAFMALVCLVSCIAFFWRFLTVKNPLVELHAFANRNFSTGCVFSFVLGIGLYGLVYLYPVYLGAIRGYSSLMIGETMCISGLAQLATTPFAGNLSRKMDPRLMLGMGLAGFALSCYMLVDVTKDWDYWELFVPQILRGGSLMFCFVPINNLALGTLPPMMVKNASGLFNLTRNLGGAVGLAVIHTLLNERWDFHLQRLHDSVSWLRPLAVERLAMLSQSLAAKLGPLSDLAATKMLAGTVRQQAMVMSFADVFLALALAFALLLIPLMMVRRPPAMGGGGGGH
jgi:MFS transporter, DHA2 family, multidrug resistance protein